MDDKTSYEKINTTVSHTILTKDLILIDILTRLTMNNGDTELIKLIEDYRNNSYIR